MRLACGLVLALVACACGGTATAPTPAALETTAPATTPGPVPATTPSPLPTPTPTPPTQVATLSGLIRDGADGNPLALVRVTIDLATTVAMTDANGRYEVPVLRSAGYPSVLVSFSRSGFASGEFGYVNVTTRTSVDWILPRACAPGFGPKPQVLVQSDSIEFSWSLRTPSGQLRYPGVTDFLLEVGRYREGTSGNFTSPDLLSVTTGGTGFYKWHTPGMAAGEYWARLRLKNDCGIGRYSPPASFTWH